MMLKTIQIIALFQGLFVLFLLYNDRKSYKNTTFWLLFGSLFSIVLYIVGDDQNNLFVNNSDWFFIDNTLFITFLFLFFRYFNSNKEKFIQSDYYFFIPNIIYLILEIIEIKLIQTNMMVEIFELLCEFTFIIYLSLILNSIISSARRHWVIYFVIPIVILLVFSLVSDIFKIVGLSELTFLSDQNFNSYLLSVIAFLFYFIAYKLFTRNNEFLPKIEIGKYKNSSLNDDTITKYKKDLINAMEKDKLYLDGKLSMQDVSDKLNIPRQYISEVLNEHMNTNFQDFINEHRVEEFVNRLKDDQNNNLTLLGIATDVGFNSKSSFNAIFKKFKGLTPTQFKKNL